MTKNQCRGHSQTLTQSDLVFINPSIYIYIYVVVNFLSQVIFHFSIVFGIKISLKTRSYITIQDKK